MNRRRNHARKTCACLCIALALALMAVGLASCGGTEKADTSEETVKLPPGASTSSSTSTSTTEKESASSSSSKTTSGEVEEEESSDSETATATPDASAVLGGAKFTVVGATRPDSNSSVTSSSGREVKGDYLEVALTVDNAATDYMVDLSEYSFRLYSPGIQAGTYSSYYGDTGTYGAYVDENEISASLLDYSTLSEVSYLLKVGESVEQLFLFFDLNPENVGTNPGVTKENTVLVISKVSGDEYGTEVTIPLAGYPD